VSLEVNDARPSSISHLVGQKAVIAQVRTAIDAAFEDNGRFDDALLCGPPGLGKSQRASVIAQEMATTFHEVLGQSLTGIGDLNALLLAVGDKDILHVDECHELDKQLQTALYLAVDKRIIFVNSKRCPEPIPIANFTLLLSTTDEFDLLAPLRDRMKLILRFEYYSGEELTVLLRHRCKALGWPIDDEVLPFIAQRSRGVPRLALRLLQSCRRACRAEGERAILPVHFERACHLEQIDGLGLGPLERKYLTILADGPTRLNVIASILGLPTRTVAEITEQFLIRAGLMIRINLECGNSPQRDWSMYGTSEPKTKAVVSKSEMARMVGLSPARFAQLVGTTFPYPRYDLKTRRPFYPEDLQEICLSVRKRNCGIDGKPVLFYARRPINTVPLRKPKRDAVVKNDYADLIDGLKGLGLVAVTAAQVGEAVKELYPQGMPEGANGAVLRALFLHLRRKNTRDNVGK